MPVNVNKDEMRDIAKQSGEDIGVNASLFYSYIEDNHKISGGSEIYDNILNDTKNSDGNRFLLTSNSSAKSTLIDSDLFTDTTSNLLSFREREFEILFEELIEEFEEIIDVDVAELLRDLDLDIFYKIEITETINKNEFNELLKQSKIFLKPNDLDNLFKSFDIDENDEIDYNELLIFIQYIKNLKKKREREKGNSFKNNYSVTDIINIDTRFRNNYYGTLSTDFTYVLPETQSDVKKISIGSIEMPMTQYNVSSKLKNNSMVIISDSNNITINKDISSSWEFKSPIGCLSGDFLHGGFIFNDDKSSVSYDTSTVTIPGTIEASGALYNNKWWDGSAVQTTNTWDSSITPIEFIEFNTKQPYHIANDTSSNVNGPSNRNKINYYSNINYRDFEGILAPLPGLGNINNNDFKNIYLSTRLIPFSYHLKNTSQTVNIENIPDSIDIPNKDLLIADTYNALYLRPGDPEKPNPSITNGERFIDIDDSKSQKKTINYFPTTILSRVDFHYPDDSSGNIIWGWSGQTFDELSKAQVTTTVVDGVPISSKTVLKERFYNPAFKDFLDPSSLHILENYYTNTTFTGGDFTSDMSNSFIQKRFASNNDVPFGSNEVTETSYTNISVLNYKKTTTINTVEVTNYNNLVHDILVEATPRITELSQNDIDISKSFINAIDGLFDDSYGDGDGMREEDITLNGQPPVSHRFKPLTKYTLYDNFSWDEHNYDISLQKNNIIKLDSGDGDSVVETKHRINNYFPHGSANRTDICWNNIKYVHGESIDYPFDSSNNIETYKTTKIIDDLHVKSYQYKDLQTGEDLTSFDPIKFAWLVTLPDGNYDETWKSSKNISSVEKLVNDSISIGIPGAIDMNGKFAAIIEPKWYNWLNNYNNNNNIANFNGRLFDRDPVKSSKVFSTNVIDIRDILFSIDRISGKSIFASKTNIVNLDNTDYNLNSTIIKVDTFTQRVGHTSLRTFDAIEPDDIKGKSLLQYQDLSLSEPSGKITPEIALLLSKAKQPIIVEDLNYKNKKTITSVRFNVDEYGNLDLESNIQLKLGWVLGFRAAEYLVGDVNSNNNNLYHSNNGVPGAEGGGDNTY